METGKTGKYLKYAIGEIVLVVIGILIALWLNNAMEIKNKIEDTKSSLIEVSDQLNIELEYIDKAYLPITIILDSIFLNIQKGNNTEEDIALRTLRKAGQNFFSAEQLIEVNDLTYQRLKQQAIVRNEFPEIFKLMNYIYTDNKRMIDFCTREMDLLMEEHLNYLVYNHDWYHSMDSIGSTEYIFNNPIYKNYISLYQQRLNLQILYVKDFVKNANELITLISDKTSNK